VWHTSVWAIAAAYFSFMQMFFSFNVSEGMIVPVPGQWSLSHNLTDVLEAYDCKSLGLHPNCSVCKIQPELASWIFPLDKMPVQGSITSLYMFWPVEMLSLCQLPTKNKTVPNSAPPNWLHDLWDLWIIAEFWDWRTTLITELENLNKDMNQTKPNLRSVEIVSTLVENWHVPMVFFVQQKVLNEVFWCLISCACSELRHTWKHLENVPNLENESNVCVGQLFFGKSLKEQNEQTECLKIQKKSLAMAKIIRSNEKIAQKI
jgi:hypothetical protein